MTLPRLSVLSTYWQSHPPVHISVAAFIGIKPVLKADPEALDFINLPDFE